MMMLSSSHNNIRNIRIRNRRNNNLLLLLLLVLLVNTVTLTSAGNIEEEIEDDIHYLRHGTMENIDLDANLLTGTKPEDLTKDLAAIGNYDQAKKLNNVDVEYNYAYSGTKPEEPKDLAFNYSVFPGVSNVNEEKEVNNVIKIQSSSNKNNNNGIEIDVVLYEHNNNYQQQQKQKQPQDYCSDKGLKHCNMRRQLSSTTSSSNLHGTIVCC